MLEVIYLGLLLLIADIIVRRVTKGCSETVPFIHMSLSPRLIYTAGKALAIEQVSPSVATISRGKCRHLTPTCRSPLPRPSTRQEIGPSPEAERLHAKLATSTGTETAVAHKKRAPFHTAFFSSAVVNGQNLFRRRPSGLDLGQLSCFHSVLNYWSRFCPQFMWKAARNIQKV